MLELTQLEKSIYKYIQECIERDGYAPSVRDICAALKIKSTSTAHSYISRLEQKGYLTKSSGKSRALKLEAVGNTDGDQVMRVPLLGRVTAGVPILAVENYEGYVDFPVSMSRGRSNLFALRVIGESMIEAGILDGDIVIVESRQYADNGDIVVAMMNDEATVKRFYREENGMVRLQPANSSMKPILVKNPTILGKVIANYRFY
ncbi:MAG TPA: transcriptional repressor LexA [Bacillota bacterium]|nr:transcriptional repressor LexA [Bacillota bacterium]HOK69215.1 transcriptional repressor LexA [Bacillota bacterium]HPP84668.1 transcriptional repressor LexA [Bacillota bacterium]